MTDDSPNVAVVQHDENVDGILFCIPDSFSEIDLSGNKTTVRTIYTLPSGGKGQQVLKKYTATSDMDTSYNYYTWDFGSLILSKPGIINFSLCIMDEDTDKVWNTVPAAIQIPETFAPVLVI